MRRLRSPVERTLIAQRMTPGAAGGKVAMVAPVPTFPVPLKTAPMLSQPYMPFSYGNSTVAPTVSESGKYELNVAGPLGIWIAKLSTAGSSTTTATVKQNGTVVGTINLASTVTRNTVDLSSILGSVGDDITVACTAVGTGALGLIVLGPIA